MVIAEVKPLAEIMELIKPYTKVLNTGCGGCAAVCLGGGQKEVDTLNTKLSVSAGSITFPLKSAALRWSVSATCSLMQSLIR